MAQLAYKETPEADAEDAFRTDMSVGEILRRSRMHYNLSLMDIERELHIKPPQIDAMETDRFDRLPGRVYAIGFIRSYSEHLGLDGDKMIKLYKRQIRGRTPEKTLQYPVCASESKLPSFWLILLSLFSIAAVGVFWGGYSLNVLKEPMSIPQVPSHLSNIRNQPVDVDRNASSYAPPANEGLNAPQPALAPEGVVLKVIENSWVDIKGADGQSLVSRVLNQGEQYFIPRREGLTLTLGNAGGVRLEIEDQDIGDIGKPGEALRDFSLDFDYLKARIETKSKNEP
ncbi:DUF4115 domain-containing protein [Alphaproteobacteria bacterium]|nr:DUF4115 domain-containing protein [Alphaproteobacteria bacterium]